MCGLCGRGELSYFAGRGSRDWGRRLLPRRAGTPRAVPEIDDRLVLVSCMWPDGHRFYSAVLREWISEKGQRASYHLRCDGAHRHSLIWLLARFALVVPIVAAERIGTFK